MVLMPTRGHATGKRVSCGSGPSNAWRAWLGWTPCRTLAPFPAKATTTGGWKATWSGLRARRHAPSTTCSWRRRGSPACAGDLIRLGAGWEPRFGVSGPLFTGVRGRGILRSPVCAAGRDSPLLGSGPRLRHVHRFELLQDAQMVPASSYHLRNLAFGEAQGSGPHPPHPLARRGDGTCGTLPVSLVGSAPAPDGGDLLPLGDLLFDRKPVVREGGEQHFGNLLGPLEQIGSHDFLQDGVLAPVMELLKVSAHDGLVLFCGHHGPPLARFPLKEWCHAKKLGAPLALIHQSAWKVNSANFAL